MVISRWIGSQLVGLARSVARVGANDEVNRAGSRRIDVPSEAAPCETTQVLIEDRLLPCLPPVLRHFDAANSASPIPRFACQLHWTSTPQPLSVRMARD